MFWFGVSAGSTEHVLLPTTEVASYYCNCKLHTHKIRDADGRTRVRRCAKEMQINQPSESVVLLRMRYWILQGSSPRSLGSEVSADSVT